MGTDLPCVYVTSSWGHVPFSNLDNSIHGGVFHMTYTLEDDPMEPEYTPGR